MILNRAAPPEGLKPRPYFMHAKGRAFEAKAESDVFTIGLYDEIGWFGVTAGEFMDALTQADGRDILLKINSPGGDVFDGIAMYNDLRDYPGKVTARIVGLAASAASIVAMGVDRVEIADSAHFMIHNAWSLAIGDRHALRALADTLDGVDQGLAEVYAAQTGGAPEDMAALMDAETWFRGQAALDAGFAHAVIGAQPAPKAAFDLSVFARAPKDLFADMADLPETRRDVERMLMQDAGFSRSRARAFMRACNATQDAGNDIAALQHLLNTIRSA